MKVRNFLGTAMKFFPLIWLLLLYVVLLCRTISTYVEEPSRLVQIWKYALQICIIIGMIGSLAVQDGVMKHITGRPQNFLTDMEERTSAEMAVPYNGLVASVFILVPITVLSALYALTDSRVFLIIIYVLIGLSFSSDGIFYVLRAAVSGTVPDSDAPSSSEQRAGLAAHAEDTLLSLCHQMLDGTQAS